MGVHNVYNSDSVRLRYLKHMLKHNCNHILNHGMQNRMLKPYFYRSIVETPEFSLYIINAGVCCIRP